MENIAIGIDLGTTNCCAFYYFNGQLKVLENKEGGRITPSVIFFTKNDEVVIGQIAKNMAKRKPEWGIFEIKRLIGRKSDDPYVQNNLKYFPFKLKDGSKDPVVVIEKAKGIDTKTPVELCTLILRKIKTDVEYKLGHSVTKAVITVPAYFNVSQREATLAAAEQTGFTVLKLLNEPTAAALTYYFENGSQEEKYVLVYDLGGGTFDVAVLKKSSNNIDIICVDGDSHLGGQDFDNIIVDYACDWLKSKYNYDPTNDDVQMRRLHNYCEEAKQILSETENTEIILEAVIKNVPCDEIPISRKKFEEMAEKLFQKTIDIVENCLRSCKLSKNDVTEIILSGGSTRIPKIQEMLSNFFGGKKLNTSGNLDECVAKGAALQAAMLHKNPDQKITSILISDVIPLSIGIATFPDIMDFIIARNTQIPTNKSKTYVNVYDQQDAITFKIFEGERINPEKNHFLGNLRISDITPAPPHQCAVIFTMSVDQNGILTVTAKEQYKDNYKELKVTYTRGHRSDKEVKNSLKDAEDYGDEDKMYEKCSKQKSFLIAYCVTVIYNIENKNLTKTYEKLYSLCTETKDKVKNMSVEDKEDIERMIEEVEDSCQTVVDKYNFKFIPTKYLDCYESNF